MSRTEEDSLGKKPIPENAYYGIQSLRAFENFPISGTQVHREFIKSYLLLKKAAAKANALAGSLDSKHGKTIVKAVDELLKKDFSRHFIIDAYQAGAGTSQNMNTNEVIANYANEILGKPLGSYSPIHPNDHVNMSQSTNDSYPTVLRLSLLALSKNLLKSLKELGRSLDQKSKEFRSVMKVARTHLQDAVPISLGQEFSAYAATVFKGVSLIEEAREYLKELGIGGSAAGTGFNVPKGFRKAILKELKILFHENDLRLSPNMCEAMQSQMPVMIYSNALRALALELTRIFNDLRLLSSGPLSGLSEIFLPATQPGSSIMPGKVNPSILEMSHQVLFKVLGNDTALAYAMQAGQLELNVMMPLMAQTTLESTAILITMAQTVRTRCIDGIQANREQCEKMTHQANVIAQATALNLTLGYAKAAALTKEALKTGKSIDQLLREKNLRPQK